VSEKEPGRILRPEPVVLGDSALIPAEHLISPPPSRFTHELAIDQPFALGAGQPAGVLRAGTPVAVLAEGEQTSRVADRNGLSVEVPTASLRPLN
jgi:hypothetical protein